MRDIFYAGSFEVFWRWRVDLGRCTQRTLDGAAESGGRKVNELYHQRVGWGSCAIPQYHYWYGQAVRRRSRNLVGKCWCWSTGCLHSPPTHETRGWSLATWPVTPQTIPTQKIYPLLTGVLPIGQVSVKRYFPGRKMHLSQITGQDFFWASRFVILTVRFLFRAQL